MLDKVLQEIRKKHGDSLRSLGEKMGINFTHISKIELGKIFASRQFIEKIIKVYPENKKEILEAHVQDVIPGDDILEILQGENYKEKDLISTLFEKLTLEEQKIFFKLIINNIEMKESFKKFSKVEKKEMDIIKKAVDKL